MCVCVLVICCALLSQYATDRPSQFYVCVLVSSRRSVASRQKTAVLLHTTHYSIIHIKLYHASFGQMIRTSSTDDVFVSVNTRRCFCQNSQRPRFRAKVKPNINKRARGRMLYAHQRIITIHATTMTSYPPDRSRA